MFIKKAYNSPINHPMKPTLLLLLTTFQLNAQIIGIDFNWNGQLQDISEVSDIPIANLSRVFMSDSTWHEATEADSITWVWSRMTKITNGFWQREVLDTAFQITPSQYIDQLCSGVFVLEVQAITSDGRKWSCQGPCRILWNASVPTCPQIMPFSFYSDNTWLNQDQAARTWGVYSYYVGKNWIGEVGDLDNDGQVNVIDLLLFNGRYGN
jgi:hypothetical protein